MTFVKLYFCVFFPRILAVIPWTRVDGRVCSNRAAKLLSIRQIFDCAAARLDEEGISGPGDHSVVYWSSNDAPWEVPRDVALNKQVKFSGRTCKVFVMVLLVTDRYVFAVVYILFLNKETHLMIALN